MAKSLGITQTDQPQDDLLAEKADLSVQKAATIASGVSIIRGQALGKITASGKYSAYDDGASDGTQVAAAIAVEDVDATAADVNTSIYVSGVFNIAKVTQINAAALDAAGQADLEDKMFIFKTVK